MAIVLGLAGIAGLVSFVCFVIVLIRLFQNESVGMGILGLICALYTFYWGWQNHKEQNITNIMTVWSVAVVIGVVVNAILRASG